jgi:hypothetical protein
MNSENENANGKSCDDTNDACKNAYRFFIEGKKHAGNNDHIKLSAMKPLNKNYSEAIVKYNRIFDILRTRLPRLKEGR